MPNPTPATKPRRYRLDRRYPNGTIAAHIINECRTQRHILSERAWMDRASDADRDVYLRTGSVPGIVTVERTVTA